MFKNGIFSALHAWDCVISGGGGGGGGGSKINVVGKKKLPGGPAILDQFLSSQKIS